jgi:rhodanese-related sulfurtransferase
MKEFNGKANPDFGTLKNAINVPVQELENRLSDIASLKEKEIIVYCSHSHRSHHAAYLLGINGFKKSNKYGGRHERNERSFMH